MAVGQPESETLSSKLGGSYVGVRNDLDVSRHVFFGETSYVVRDPISFEGHNFSPEDYEILISLRDDRPLSEVFDDLLEMEVVDEDVEEDFYRFVIELQKRSLLSLPVTDGEALYTQYEEKQKRKKTSLFKKMISFKIPLGCPDKFLKTTYHRISFLFTRTFFCIWLVGLMTAGWLVISRWELFTSDLGSVLAIQNLPAILIVMTVLKLWHEMGHGYACRHFGVSVPNAGLLLMLGTPLAFVDATGSWSLSKRWQRQVINLAGMYFEMMIAIAATFVWSFTNNPSVASIAHFTILIASVTTIGFNFNPLMKYDGYFVLADFLGIPNLKTRSALAARNLTKSVFFRIPVPPSNSKSLQTILVIYGISSAIYKLTLAFGISILLAMQIWVVGLMVGFYYLITSLGGMVWKLIKYLLWSDEVAQKKPLAMVYLGLLVVGIPAAFWMLPVPGRSQARGVVESSRVSVVHVEEGGFLKSPIVKIGQRVAQGETIGEIENINSVATHHRKQAELRQLEMQYRTEQLEAPLKASQTNERIGLLKYDLGMAKSIHVVEQVHAPLDGQVIFCSHQRTRGNYLAPGDELLRIGSEGWVIRAVADAHSLADVRPQVGQTVHCRFYSDPSHVYEGTIQRVSRVGSRVMQHKALTHLAGGFIPVDPETMEATEPFFELRIELATEDIPDFLRNGTVCEVRFRKKYEPMGNLVYRSILRFATQLNLK